MQSVKNSIIGISLNNDATFNSRIFTIVSYSLLTYPLSNNNKKKKKKKPKYSGISLVIYFLELRELYLQ